MSGVRLAQRKKTLLTSKKICKFEPQGGPYAAGNLSR
jgi:hypothetical protein